MLAPDERLGEKLRLGADMLCELLRPLEKLLRLGAVVARVLLSRELLRPNELLRLLPNELLRLLPNELLRLLSNELLRLLPNELLRLLPYEPLRSMLRLLP